MSEDSLFIHPTAEISEGAIIGRECRIWNGTKIREGARLGSDCTIGQQVYIDVDVTIGDGCKVQNSTNIYRGVTVGNRVFIGPAVVFTNDRYPRAQIWNNERLGYTILEDGCSIGGGAVIVCGTAQAPRRIGRAALVAAGAVVTRDVPAHVLVSGNPARMRVAVTDEGIPATQVVSQDEDCVVLRAPQSGETVRISHSLYVQLTAERANHG